MIENLYEFFEKCLDGVQTIPEDKIYGEYRRFASRNGNEAENLNRFMDQITDDRYLFDMYSIVTGLVNE